jgi:hypothetical protein
VAYDPIKDERKPMSLHEWEAELKEAVVQYAAQFRDNNDWTAVKRTFNEWMRAFGAWMSW